MQPPTRRARPSRMATVHVRPSVTGNQLGPRQIRSFEAVFTAPHMTPVYTSDASLPKRPQDSVSACLLGLRPDRTFPVSYLQFHQRAPGVRRKSLVRNDLATSVSERCGTADKPAGNSTKVNSLLDALYGPLFDTRCTLSSSMHQEDSRLFRFTGY